MNFDIGISRKLIKKNDFVPQLFLSPKTSYILLQLHLFYKQSTRLGKLNDILQCPYTFFLKILCIGL